nr:MAG TPA: Protein of unknown function (DUF4051) [Caudoviricetes sp.]
MTAPCKDCPDRQLGCHAACDRYRAFRAERDEMLEARRKWARNYRPQPNPDGWKEKMQR